MKAPDLHPFADPESMAEALAADIAALLREAVDARGRAVLAVSGGSTPLKLYEALSRSPLDWGSVDVVLVDERFVPPGAAGSNESAVRAALMQGEAAAAAFHGLWSKASSLEAAAQAADVRVGELPSPLDAAILGMGTDGHTASWFPHAGGLKDALGEAVRVAPVRAKKSPVTGDLTERLTLTMKALGEARALFLLLAGAEKRAAFQDALQDGPVEAAPIRALIAKRPDMKVCWAS